MPTVPTRLTLAVVSLIVLARRPAGCPAGSNNPRPSRSYLKTSRPQSGGQGSRTISEGNRCPESVGGLQGRLGADVGAENGDYVQRMADLVGPMGKVFAEDVSDHSIELHQRVKAYDLRDVEVVRFDIGNPAVPTDWLPSA